jgi:mannosyltransferase
VRVQEFAGGEKSERFAEWGIGVLIAYTALRNVWAAAARPFWYDELCTVAVARPSSVSATWAALQGAKDGNPPLFYLIEHFARNITANELVSYRLLSIAGFCCVLWFLFGVIRKRNGSAVAFICSAVVLLTPLYRPYAVEARPYSMVVACIAIALFCYQRAPRTLWVILMGLSLALAEALHFYALFGFVPFAVAEAAMIVRTKRVRWGVWAALAFGFLPLAFSWRILAGFKAFYGAHFWAPATLVRLVNSYALFFKTFGPIAVSMVVILAIVALWPGRGEPADFHERLLAVALLGLPLVAFIAAKVGHAGFVERYGIPAVLGMPLALAYMLRMFGRRSLACFAAFVMLAVTLQEGFFWTAESGAFGKLVSPADPIERLLNRSAARSDLPVVVSDGHEYVPAAYYASPEWAKRLVAVADPEQAITSSGSDSLDKQLLALRCCLTVQVYEFRDFAAGHPSFLLYSGGGELDWWPFRLLHDGYSLQLLAAEGNHRLYLATAMKK